MSRQTEQRSSLNNDIETITSVTHERLASTGSEIGFSLSGKEVPEGKIVNSVTKSSQVRIENTSNNYYNAPVVINQIYHRQSDNVEQSSKDDEPAEAENAFFKRICSICRSKVQRVHSTKCYVVVPALLLLSVVLIIVLVIWLSHDKNSHRLYPPSPSNATSNQSGYLRIVSREEWNATPQTCPAQPLKNRPPSLVIINHTRTMLCYFLEQCVISVKSIQNNHMYNRSFDDIGYNFLVGGDGFVYEGRGWDVAGAHTLAYNHFSIGIGVIGTFEREEPTKVQLVATQQLMKYGVKSGYIGVDYKLFGHRQCDEKSKSPGDAFYKILTTWEHWSPNCQLKM